jgi:adenosylcobyric acid synthase
VTTAGPHAQPHLAEGLGWQQDNVIGVYLHGIFANTAYRQWWLSTLGWRGTTQDWWARLDAELNRIAELVGAGWADSLLVHQRQDTLASTGER